MWASLVVQMVKNHPIMEKAGVWSQGWEDPLEKGMATRSSILAWRIPWTGEPRGATWGCKESDTTKQQSTQESSHENVFNIIVHDGIKPHASLKSQWDTSTHTVQWKRCIALKDDEDVDQLFFLIFIYCLLQQYIH